MKKKLLSVIMTAVLAVGMLAGCGNSTAKTAGGAASGTQASNEAGAKESGHSVGFVTFGLGGDFFQKLADEYVSVFTEAGWEAEYTDGEFNPETQIKACENYIAKDVDVLVCWSVAPEAMGDVIAQCEAKGIKFVAFVAPTATYDAVMISDDAQIADTACKLAALWIDKKFADAEDHSVPVAVFTERDANTGVIQADELLKIAEFSKKAAEPTEVACSAETAEEGQNKAETMFTQNPDVKVILTAHSAIATGVNSYMTSLSSPIKDYSDRGIFCINGDTAMCEEIEKSAKDESPLRGTVMTGSVNDTAKEMLYVCDGVMSGQLEKGYKQMAGTTLLNADTVAEYLADGKVTSLTADQLK